jgi:hypothetical protein
MTVAAVASAPVVEAWFPSNASNREWAVLSGHAPQLVATMRRYLLQLTTFLSPRSVEVADTTLRQLARWLTTKTDIAVVADIERTHVEDYKVWLAAQPGQKGQLLAKNTQRHRLRRTGVTASCEARGCQSRRQRKTKASWQALHGTGVPL